MQKVLDFFKLNKNVFIWTLGYFIVVWLILWLLFGFNLFSSIDWNHLMRARLRGFGAFVFGIFLLGAVPLYVATTIITMRTKELLIKIPVPKIFQSKSEEVSVQNVAEPEQVAPAPTFPANLPPELRERYLRVRAHIEQGEISQINKIESQITFSDTPTMPEESDLPLPPDFDVLAQSDDDGNEWVPMDGAPVFADVDFGISSNSGDSDVNPIVAFMDNAKQKYSVYDDDIIVTDKFAIIGHFDSSFWIADDENWFAQGKQIVSPVARVKKYSDENNLTPVLYLGATNIMGLDERIENWTNQGVVVIDDLNGVL